MHQGNNEVDTKLRQVAKGFNDALGGLASIAPHGPSANQVIAAALAAGMISARSAVLTAEMAVSLYRDVLETLERK